MSSKTSPSLTISVWIDPISPHVVALLRDSVDSCCAGIARVLSTLDLNPSDVPRLISSLPNIIISTRNWDDVESLLTKMLEKGITPDNITISVVISCARFCNLPAKAVEWFEKMSEFGLTPDDVTYSAIIDVTQWSLHVKSLSLGATLTALKSWMDDMSEARENGEELPPLLVIHTGHEEHKYSKRGLASLFESRLREMNAPFHEASDKVGWFLTTNIATKSWLGSSFC